MMAPVSRRHRRAGAMAVLQAELQSAPPPQNPFPKGTVRHRYWQSGAELGARFLDQLGKAT